MDGTVLGVNYSDKEFGGIPVVILVGDDYKYLQL